MADVQFEEESQYQRSGLTEQKPFFIRLVFKTGLATTDRGAEYVLLAVAVFAIIVAFAFPLLMGGSSGTPTAQDKVRALTAPGMVPVRR